MKLKEYNNYRLEPKPGKINKNEHALSTTKMNHFKQCSEFHSKLNIFTSNEDSTEKLDEKEQLDPIEN